MKGQNRQFSLHSCNQYCVKERVTQGSGYGPLEWHYLTDCKVRFFFLPWTELFDGCHDRPGFGDASPVSVWFHWLPGLGWWTTDTMWWGKVPSLPFQSSGTTATLSVKLCRHSVNHCLCEHMAPSPESLCLQTFHLVFPPLGRKSVRLD